MAAAVGVVAGLVLPGAAATQIDLAAGGTPSDIVGGGSDPLRSYQLRVPDSLNRAAGNTREEEAAFRQLTRNLKVDKAGTISDTPAPVTRVSRGLAGNVVGSVAMSLGLGVAFSVGDSLFGGWLSEQANEDLCRPGETAEGGYQEWAEGNRHAFAAFLGVQCTELEREDDWEPIAPEIDGWPVNNSASNVNQASVDMPRYYTGYQVGSRVVDGWIYPIQRSGSPTSATYFQATFHALYPDGTTKRLTNAGSTVSVGGATVPCSGWSDYFCVFPARNANFWDQLEDDAMPYMSSYYTINLYGGKGNTVTLPIPPYVAPGAPGQDYPSGGEPMVELETTVETPDGTKYTCTTRTFRESEDTIPAPCEPNVPDGAQFQSKTVNMVDPITGGVIAEMSREEVTPEYEKWREEFPHCATTVCLVDLIKIGQGSCFDLDEVCDGWYYEQNKEQTYRCEYDGVVVDLSECRAYAPMFNPAKRDAGQAYLPSDPTAGTGSQTSTGGQTGRQPVGGTVRDPEEERECFPSGWGMLNPVNWVLQPVGCALEYAFVPSPTHLAKVAERVRTAFSGTLMGQGAGIVAAWSGSLNVSASGCSGPPVDLSMIPGLGQSGTQYPLSACSEPYSTLASWSKIGMVALAGLAAALACVRMIAGTFGYQGIGSSRGDDS